MASTLRIENDTKERFDKAQIEVSTIQGKMATQDDTLKALLEKWEAKA